MKKIKIFKFLETLQDIRKFDWIRQRINSYLEGKEPRLEPVNVNDLRDEHGRTPLHYATTQLRFRIFKSICIMYRPNINVPDSDGRTALHLACLLGYVDVGHTYITRKLLALKT